VLILANHLVHQHVLSNAEAIAIFSVIQTVLYCDV